MPELVALQSLLPQIDTPDVVAGKAMKMQMQQAAQQQAQAEAQARQQALADDQGARAAFAANPTDGVARLNALAGVSPKLYAAEAKQQADLASTGATTKAKEIETAGKKIDLAGQAYGYVRNNPTPENAMSAVQYLVDSGVYSPEHAAGVIEKIKANPGNIKALADQAFASALSAKDQLAKIDTRDTGGQVQQISTDPVTGKVTTLSTLAKTQTPDSIASNARIAAEGEANRRSQQSIAGARLAFDKSKEEGNTPSDLSEATVDAIGQGRMKAPTGYALRNPKMANLMDRVNAKYQDFDATEYDAKQKAMRDFSTGTQGNSIRSFAVATDHLGQMDKLVDALDNGNIPLVNKYGNKIAAATGSVAPTNFDAAKLIVGKEVLKAIVAGGGGVEERQELAHTLDNAKSTKQLKGVIQSYSHLMEAQKNKLERQYELSTGRKDAKKRFAYSSDEAAPAATPLAKAPALPAGWSVQEVK